MGTSANCQGNLTKNAGGYPRWTSIQSRGVVIHSELPLRRTPSGPAQTVCLREVSAYKEFRYSNVTEKWHAGTNTKCLSYRGVRLIEVSVKRELTVCYGSQS